MSSELIIDNKVDSKVPSWEEQRTYSKEIYEMLVSRAPKGTYLYVYPTKIETERGSGTALAYKYKKI